MKELLTNPEKFSKELMMKDVNMIPPFVILFIIGIISTAASTLLLSIIIESVPKESMIFISFGAIIGVIFSISSVFLMWFLLSCIFHTLTILFRGNSCFRRVFEFVGYGFTPFIFSSIIALLAIVHIASSTPFLADDYQLLSQNIMQHPFMQVISILNIFLIIWCANIWIFAIKHARNLSTKNAIICPPVGAAVAGLIL
jgi:hypothetical protein